MMLGELERGEGVRGQGLHTLVVLAPLMASPPWWAGDSRWPSPPWWSRQMALGCGAEATLSEHRNWLLQLFSAHS